MASYFDFLRDLRVLCGELSLPLSVFLSAISACSAVKFSLLIPALNTPEGPDWEVEHDGIALPAADDAEDRRLCRQEEAGAGRAVPDGPDARTPARLQPDLYRVRADSRIRIDDQAEALDPGMPGRGR